MSPRVVVVSLAIAAFGCVVSPVGAHLTVGLGFTQEATPSAIATVRMQNAPADSQIFLVSSIPNETRSATTFSFPYGNLSAGWNPTPGLDIVIQAGPALAANGPALSAFNRAVATWEGLIKDPITVTIEANFATLPTNVLGSTSNVVLGAPYANPVVGIVDHMKMDALNEADDGVVAWLPPSAAGLNANVPSGFIVPGLMSATKANLKATGMSINEAPVPSGGWGIVDSNILFASTGFNFDYDRSNGISPGSYDFEGIVAHEIGHALGFISDLDMVEFLDNGGTPAPGDPRASWGKSVWPTPLDLFRFPDATTNDPQTLSQFGTKFRSFVPGSKDVWDQIDGSYGGDVEVLVSTGVADGDGHQASHWKDNLGLGIFDPTIAPGELVMSPSINDLRALDLIGYDINMSDITAVPEPSSFLFLSIVGVAMGAVCKLRRSTVC